MKKIAAFALSVVCAAPLMAADKPAQEDSPLVRAAKIGAAKRQQLAGKDHIVIDDAHLLKKGGHITTTANLGELPPAKRAITSTPQKPVVITVPLSPPERAKLQKRVDDLKLERAKLTDQADQPVSDEGNEDTHAKRLAEIQKELADAERKLGTSARPSHPPQ